MGAYIARVAGPPLTTDELEAGTARLEEMLHANTHEALGEEAAALAHQIPRVACTASDRRSSCGYGDGHLHPHEWIARGDGALFKVDGVGHDCDHTLVGKQPVVWDLAGAIVEWGLDREGADRLLAAYYAAGGERVDADALRFYRAAYLAFRAGQCALAAQVHDPYERPRLWDAYARYREKLEQDLRDLQD